MDFLVEIAGFKRNSIKSARQDPLRQSLKPVRVFTAGSNLMIGGIFVLLGLFFGQNALSILNLLPLLTLGVLLVFAGSQLGVMIRNLTERKGLLVGLIMLGVALTGNLAAAFMCGIIIAYALKSEKNNLW